MLNINQIQTHRESLEAFQSGYDAAEAAQMRLDYITKVKAVFVAAIKKAASEAPWFPLPESEITHAIGCMGDLVDNLFYDAAEDDRETVEREDAKEAREYERCARSHPGRI